MLPKLRPYQVEPMRAIVRSVLDRQGHTFSIMMSRQAGKNELSAQLEVLLLTMFLARGGNIVKCSPTFKPQTINSMLRLKERLTGAGLGRLWRTELGYMIRVGRARAIFFSAEPTANVVGATAHILLEVDEAQDVSKEKYNKDFKPMGSTTNVTTVVYGTAWDDSTLLEEVKQLNLELERKDGIQRHFEYNWEFVARYNENYRRYVEAERERLGADHPLFLTQYELRPLRLGGGFLSPQQLAQLQGDHPRQHLPTPGRTYIAGLDLAGEAEQAEDAVLRSLSPRRDSTVLTIGEVEFSPSPKMSSVPLSSHPAGHGASPPLGERLLTPCNRVRIVEHIYRTGTKHAALYAELVDLLKNVWRVRRVLVDATGVGAAVASFLREALGESIVQPFVFTAASKSRLAFGLLAAINSGGLKMYQPDGSEEYQQFWFQARRARYSVRANQTMNFYVDPTEGHDDFLMSMALLVEAASQYRPRSARGRQPGNEYARTAPTGSAT